MSLLVIGRGREGALRFKERKVRGGCDVDATDNDHAADPELTRGIQVVERGAVRVTVGILARSAESLRISRGNRRKQSSRRCLRPRIGRTRRPCSDWGATNGPAVTLRDQSTHPDRIALDVASRLRIVVSEVVVEESGLLVQILAGQYPNKPPDKERFSTAPSLTRQPTAGLPVLTAHPV